MFTRKPRLRPEKFAINGAKRLLQHNRHKAAEPGCPLNGRYEGMTGHAADMRKLTRLTPEHSAQRVQYQM